MCIVCFSYLHISFVCQLSSTLNFRDWLFSIDKTINCYILHIDHNTEYYIVAYDRAIQLGFECCCASLLFDVHHTLLYYFDYYYYNLNHCKCPSTTNSQPTITSIDVYWTICVYSTYSIWNFIFQICKGAPNTIETWIVCVKIIYVKVNFELLCSHQGEIKI